MHFKNSKLGRINVGFHTGMFFLIIANDAPFRFTINAVSVVEIHQLLRKTYLKSSTFSALPGVS
jgi:hypothetical protein